MHIFQWNILVFLSLHLIAGFLTMASVLGMPGNLEESKPAVKKIVPVFNVLLRICWSGITWLFLASLTAFYFQQLLIGQLLSVISIILGLSLLISLVMLYKAK